MRVVLILFVVSLAVACRDSKPPRPEFLKQTNFDDVVETTYSVSWTKTTREDAVAIVQNKTGLDAFSVEVGYVGNYKAWIVTVRRAR